MAVATGQITIVDNNDAKPLTAWIQANPGIQNIYDPATLAYTPDWTSGSGLVLTAKCYVGGNASDIASSMTSQTWKVGTTSGTALSGTTVAGTDLDAAFDAGAIAVTPTTLTIDANLDDTAAGTCQIIWEADYTDPVTTLTTHVIASIQLSVIKTGSNAVFVQVVGPDTIEQSSTSTKNAVSIAANLVRASGYDTSNLEIRWYETNGTVQITSATSGLATKYGHSFTTAGNFPSQALAPGIGTFPTAGNWSAWGTYNTLTIGEPAVNGVGNFKAEIRDTTDGTVVSTYFTLRDISDPYQCTILSSNGDKLQNGLGSTVLSVAVYYGGTLVTPMTGWTYDWQFRKADGKRACFVAAGIFTSGGQTVSANTIGPGATFTYGGTNRQASLGAGDIIKLFNPVNNDVVFFEVASSGVNTVTVRTATTNTWLNTDYPASGITVNEYVNYQMFKALANYTTATVTLDKDDIDVKGSVTCDVTKP